MKGWLMAAALALAPALTAAQDGRTPMDGAAFRAYAEGWTLHFELDGVPFGAETYLPGDRVVWRPQGGDCAHGRWVEAGASTICFIYEALVSCWRLYRDPAGLSAEQVAQTGGDGGGPDLRATHRERAPVACGDAPMA